MSSSPDWPAVVPEAASDSTRPKLTVIEGGQGVVEPAEEVVQPVMHFGAAVHNLLNLHDLKHPRAADVETTISNIAQLRDLEDGSTRIYVVRSFITAKLRALAQQTDPKMFQHIFGESKRLSGLRVYYYPMLTSQYTFLAGPYLG